MSNITSKAFRIAEKKPAKITLGVILALSLLAAAVVPLYLIYTSRNQANAYLDGFDPGNIMSDFVMGNKNTNELFSDDIQGFYDTKTGSMVEVSVDNLKDIDFIINLLETYPTLAVIFGTGEINTLDNVSGFVGGEAILDYINSKLDSKQVTR